MLNCVQKHVKVSVKIVRYFSPILNLMWRDRLAIFLHNKFNKNAPPTSRVDRYSETNKHVSPIIFLRLPQKFALQVAGT
jgi:hypothetical protein